MATLLVGAVALTGAIGFTACDNDGDEASQNGVEVTAEEWVEAFDNSINAASCSAKFKSEDAESGFVNFKEQKKEYSSEIITAATILFDGANGKSYTEMHKRGTSNGYEAAFGSEEYIDGDWEYSAKQYFLAEEHNLYSVMNDSFMESSEWVVRQDYLIIDTVDNEIGRYLSGSFSVKKMILSQQVLFPNCIPSLLIQTGIILQRCTVLIMNTE